MKSIITFLFTLTLIATVNAQVVQGKLTLNEKSTTNLELKTNSAVHLFKAFKTGQYALKFNFKSKDVPQNIYNETIVFFDFITIIKKDGELVKNVQRKQPIPYFPGDMDLPAEAFDFIGILADLNNETKTKKSFTPGKNSMKNGYQGIMPEGKYTVQLIAKPIGYKGDITPLEFSFVLRKI